LGGPSARAAVVYATQGNYAGGAFVAAHELAHLFGALDEYARAEDRPETPGGVWRVPNRNHVDATGINGKALPHAFCMMDSGVSSSLRLCGATRAHIGWGDVLCDVHTSNFAGAGTDDDVFYDVGEHQFLLDTPEDVYDPAHPAVNDHERDTRGLYAFRRPELDVSDFKRHLLRKGGEAAIGDWRPGDCQMWFRGEPLATTEVFQFLGGDRPVRLLRELAPPNDDLVHLVTVTVGTAPDLGAGTDDDVFFELAGRRFLLDKWFDDFEAGSTTTYVFYPGLALRRPDITSVSLSKAAQSGPIGDWKLRSVRVVLNEDATPMVDEAAINTWLSAAVAHME
jgi:hypothetical protein